MGCFRPDPSALRPLDRGFDFWAKNGHLCGPGVYCHAKEIPVPGGGRHGRLARRAGPGHGHGGRAHPGDGPHGPPGPLRPGAHHSAGHAPGFGRGQHGPSGFRPRRAPHRARAHRGRGPGARTGRRRPGLALQPGQRERIRPQGAHAGLFFRAHHHGALQAAHRGPEPRVPQLPGAGGPLPPAPGRAVPPSAGAARRRVLPGGDAWPSARPTTSPASPSSRTWRPWPPARACKRSASRLRPAWPGRTTTPRPRPSGPGGRAGRSNCRASRPPSACAGP